MPFCKPIAVIFMVVAPALCADPRRAGPQQSAPPSPDPVAAQWQAVAVMQAALAAQRASIARQAAQPAGHSFFLLPPPTSSLAASQTSTGNCDPLPAAELIPLIDDAARREQLAPELLHSVVRQESGARPCAVSPKGAMGLMQLMPATAKALGVSDPFQPKQNVDAGAKLLRGLLDTYGNLPMALGAYNAGPAKVNESGGVPNIPETVDYVQKIMGTLLLDRATK
jgi:soluble lytic murein transglycosylase-like protein